MQRAIFSNNPELALYELENKKVNVPAFGEVRYYKNEINDWTEKYHFMIEKFYALRTFFALHPDNKSKYDENWQSNMLKLEEKVAEMEEFQNLSFYQHILLKKLK